MIRVFNKKAVNALAVSSQAEEEEEANRGSPTSQDKSFRSVYTAEELKMLGKIKQRELRREEEEAIFYSRMEAIKIRRLAEERKREMQFTESYKKLKEGENTVVAEISDYLNTKAATENQKKTSVYNDWTEKVFNRVQYQILSQVEPQTDEEISVRRTKCFNEFLKASKKNGGLYLDIVINSEYDPFSWKKYQTKYDKTILEDPMKRDLKKLELESASSTSPGKKPVPLGKDTLPLIHWTKIEATPFYDRVAAADDAVKRGAKKRETKSRTVIDLNDYKIISDGGESSKREHQILYGKGKRVYKDWTPGKSLSQ